MFENLCDKNPDEVSTLSLAYIGDAIFELYTRLYIVGTSGEKLKAVYKKSIMAVSAKGQAKAIHNIADILSEKELSVYKRGRNTKTSATAKNADPAEYRAATGAEVLIGYLFLKKEYDRLKFLIEKMVVFSVGEGRNE